MYGAENTAWPIVTTRSPLAAALTPAAAAAMIGGNPGATTAAHLVVCASPLAVLEHAKLLSSSGLHPTQRLFALLSAWLISPHLSEAS